MTTTKADRKRGDLASLLCYSSNTQTHSESEWSCSQPVARVGLPAGEHSSPASGSLDSESRNLKKLWEGGERDFSTELALGQGGILACCEVKTRPKANSSSNSNSKSVKKVKSKSKQKEKKHVEPRVQDRPEQSRQGPDTIERRIYEVLWGEEGAVAQRPAQAEHGGSSGRSPDKLKAEKKGSGRGSTKVARVHSLQELGLDKSTLELVVKARSSKVNLEDSLDPTASEGDDQKEQQQQQQPASEQGSFESLHAHCGDLSRAMACDAESDMWKPSCPPHIDASHNRQGTEAEFALSKSGPLDLTNHPEAEKQITVPRAKVVTVPSVLPVPVPRTPTLEQPSRFRRPPVSRILSGQPATTSAHSSPLSSSRGPAAKYPGSKSDSCVEPSRDAGEGNTPTDDVKHAAGHALPSAEHKPQRSKLSRPPIPRASTGSGVASAVTDSPLLNKKGAAVRFPASQSDTCIDSSQESEEPVVAGLRPGSNKGKESKLTNSKSGRRTKDEAHWASDGSPGPGTPHGAPPSLGRKEMKPASIELTHSRSARCSKDMVHWALDGGSGKRNSRSASMEGLAFDRFDEEQETKVKGGKNGHRRAPSLHDLGVDKTAIALLSSRSAWLSIRETPRESSLDGASSAAREEVSKEKPVDKKLMDLESEGCSTGEQAPVTKEGGRSPEVQWPIPSVSTRRKGRVKDCEGKHLRQQQGQQEHVWVEEVHTQSQLLVGREEAELESGAGGVKEVTQEKPGVRFEQDTEEDQGGKFHWPLIRLDTTQARQGYGRMDTSASIFGPRSPMAVERDENWEADDDDDVQGRKDLVNDESLDEDEPEWHTSITELYLRKAELRVLKQTTS